MPRKSMKARGKARARHTPSPTLTLTPPPLPRRRGRPPGAGTYSSPELRLLLKIIRKCQPQTASDWLEVERQYNASVPPDRRRLAANLRSRFSKLVRMPKPTGDPEGNRLHEEALLLDEELDALEPTHVLDDLPTPADTIDISSSEPDMELEDLPAPIVIAPAPTLAPQKRKVEPSPAFRAVARKVGSNSRPAQAQNLLDSATSQIASVFNPAAEDRVANRQRDDITIITLNDTIRDLRAELSQEREHRFALERQLRDEEMRRLVDLQVQQQLRQHLPAYQATQPQAGNFPRPSYHHRSDYSPSIGEAHPSWMPGPPPERTDASGSGGA
ncbi:hypothetical protein RSOL_395920, partial [Rhizoctonia solani AG-3 Rhs1AP]